MKTRIMAGFFVARIREGFLQKSRAETWLLFRVGMG